VILLTSTATFACKLTRIRRITNIYFNTETGETFKKGKSIQSPASLISDCKSSQNAKFLIVSSGIEEPQMRGINISRNVYLADYDHGKSSCKIKNNPFKSFGRIDEKNSFSAGKKKLFLSCLETFISNMGPGGLSYPDKQEGCVIKRLNKTIASFKGGKCVFNIRKNSHFNIWTTGNKECGNVNFLKNNGINPQEIKAGLQFATTATNDEELKGFKNIGVTYINAMIDPIDFMPKSFNDSDEKKPSWPTVWFFPDIHFSELKLTERNDDLGLTLNLLVNNYCPKTCKDGICTGPCFYNLPLAGEVTFFIFEKDRWEFAGSRYVGGSIPTFYEGIFKVHMKFKKWGHEIKNNDRFKIEFNFHDPREDFLFFQRAFKRNIGRLRRIPRTFNGGGLGSTGGLGSLSGDFPEYGELGEFSRNTNNINHSFNSAIKEFEEMFSKGQDWPPFYDKICSPYMDKCTGFGELKKVATLTAEFVIDGSQSERVSNTFSTGYKMVHTVNKIIEERKSPLFMDNENEKIEKEIPKIECN